MTTHRQAPTPALDDPWLAEPPQRSRFRLVLVLLLAAAVVFYAGVEVQKRYGSGSSNAAAAGPQAGGFTPPSGGVFPGGGQVDQGSGTSDTSDVIGTVVSLKGDKLVVEDFGGTQHTITLGSDLRVVLETTGDAEDVERGSTVQVSGQADDQGRLTATTITIR